jgi:penicillin V acylase-like amidase (Ntn superfamily)
MRPSRCPILALCLLLMAPALFSLPARACTVFGLHTEDAWIVGKNYDWSIGEGLVIVNKRGVAKVACTADTPARWTSEYGSITFNQYGRELPTGGMNEAGLVVESLWLDEAAYPPPDSRPTVSDLQWVQYQLDTAGSVDEVVASDALIRINPDPAAPLHFFVCDAQGDCAAIEFLDGQMVVHTGADMPYPALTNNTYTESEAFARGLTDHPLSPASEGGLSLKRFVWAARDVAEFDPATVPSPVDYAFGALAKTAGPMTQWRIVYDAGNGQIFFLTRANPNIRSFDTDNFDFACGTPVMVLDMSGAGLGDVAAGFKAYSRQANLELIRTAFSGTDFLAGVPEAARVRLACYPESLRCAP